jgi:hypothetical protein
MSTEPDHSLRTRALSEFLEQRVAEGFKIETRTDTHAIIVSPRGLAHPLGLLRRPRNRRHVVSVDQNGVVTDETAEPIRW